MQRSPVLDEFDVRLELSRRCTAMGSRIAFAQSNDMSASYVCDVIAGKRAPGTKILKALGLERVTRYVKS